MQIKLLVEGGSMSPGPALSQKLGPIGINIGQVIQKVNEATKNFHGLKVPVELDIDASTKEFEVKVFSPPVSELLKKELEIEKGSGVQKKLQVANASIEQIISVAKTKFPNLLCKDLKAAVKIVVGICMSLGVLVESKDPKKVMEQVTSGKYDKIIQEEKTETSEAKKAELEKYFLDLKEKQEKMIEQEEAEAEAEKEAKAKEEAEPETEERGSEKAKLEEVKEEKGEEEEKK